MFRPGVPARFLTLPSRCIAQGALAEVSILALPQHPQAAPACIWRTKNTLALCSSSNGILRARPALPRMSSHWPSIWSPPSFDHTTKYCMHMICPRPPHAERACYVYVPATIITIPDIYTSHTCLAVDSINQSLHH